MTENPLKEKIKQVFIENDRAHKEFSVAIDKWTISWDRLCKGMAKELQEIIWQYGANLPHGFPAGQNQKRKNKR